MIRALVTCLLFIFPFVVLSQTRKADSLKAVLANSQGEAKLTVLNKLAYELIGNDNAMADHYADEAIKLGEEINNQRHTGIAYSQKGVNAYLSGYYPKALRNLKKGLALAQKSNDRPNQGYTLLQLGNCYMDKGVFDSSKIYFNKAYEILKDSANPLNLSKLYRNLSVLYRFSSNVEMQEKYLNRALKINYALRDDERIIDVLVLRAVLFSRQAKYDSANKILDVATQKAATMRDNDHWKYEINFSRALFAIAQSNYDIAFQYMDSVRKYFAQRDLPKRKTVFLKNIGRAFGIQGDYELALQNLYEALAIAEKNGYFNDALETLCELGRVTHYIGDPVKSISFAERALKNSTEVNSPLYIVQALNLKGLVLGELGKFDEGRKLLRASMDTCTKYNNYIGLIEAHTNLSHLEIKARRSDVALPLLKKAVALSEQSHYAHGELWAHLALAKVNIELNRLSPAKDELAIGEKLTTITPEKEAIIEVYNLKKQFYKSIGDFQQSLRFAELASNLKDSIHSTELINRFANLQRLDEIQQRERNIQLLTQEKELNEAQIKLKDSRLQVQYILVAAAVVGIIILLLTTIRFRSFYKKIMGLNEAIQELNEQLEIKVGEKTASLSKANEELVRSNNNLQQFSYVVSHNLRGPIARILGLTSILKSAQSDAERQKILELTHQSSIDLDNIVSDLSKIINLKGGRGSLEPVDLHAEFTLALQQNAIPESLHSNVKANFNNIPKVHSVKAFVQSCFYNLLNNAYKYRSPERELKISVEAKQVDNAIEIIVSDNGLGIDLSKHRESVFKLFKRFHVNGDGRGLGLYLVKEQLEALGGTIDIQSEPEVGTTFLIRHPL